MNFPFRLPATPEHGGALPASADVVVIGGGVIGVTAALWLARVGMRVVLLEKGRIAAEQSSRNWGWIRVQGRDPAEIPVAQEAQRLWQALDAECGGRLGVRQVGVSYLARRPADLARYAAWLEAARPFDVSTRLLDRTETSALFPDSAGGWLGALHTPTDMKAEPWVAVPELARLAAAEGATIREACAVRALDIAGGRVAGVVTERGRTAAPEVLLAGGAWSSLLLRAHGLRVPQLSVRSTALATTPLSQRVAGAGVDDRVAFRPRADGGCTLAPSVAATLYLGPDALRAAPYYLPVVRQGTVPVRLRPAAPAGFPDAWRTRRRWDPDRESPFERTRILDPAPDRRGAAAALRGFEAAFPALGPVRAARVWAGMIDAMPDVVPVVDRAAGLPGLTLAFGMSGHGFGIGPAFGRIAADLIRGSDPGHGLARFRLSRFSDGSAMVPGPNV